MKSVRSRKFPTDPMEFSAFEPVYKKAPALGENNVEVIGELGYSEEEILAMEKRVGRRVLHKKQTIINVQDLKC